MQRRLDAAHGPPGTGDSEEVADSSRVTRLQALLAEERMSLRDAAELVDSSVVLRRAVMRAVTSVEVGWSQPVEGTLHALSILGTRRLQRVAHQLAASIARPATSATVR